MYQRRHGVGLEIVRKSVDLHPPLRIIRGAGGPYPTKTIDKVMDDNGIP
jgi:hypothetical protein